MSLLTLQTVPSRSGQSRSSIPREDQQRRTLSGRTTGKDARFRSSQSATTASIHSLAESRPTNEAGRLRRSALYDRRTSVSPAEEGGQVIPELRDTLVNACMICNASCDETSFNCHYCSPCSNVFQTSLRSQPDTPSLPASSPPSNVMRSPTSSFMTPPLPNDPLRRVSSPILTSRSSLLSSGNKVWRVKIWAAESNVRSSNKV